MVSAAHLHSDFALAPADIDIGYGVSQWPNRALEPLLRQRMGPLARPAFVARHGLKTRPQLLQAPPIPITLGILQSADGF